ncbi:Sugar kinase of the NBD/HSP70 family, may contain an N-terminal HTH domain [Arboricoccus pini]|uniref:Sugar kinase of the NBD/HSP70 family, may contain an N-terminal HTH domain n=1 Tax=Arboricoccus pini TaxID=1963835 RepID=A0A212RYT8_9PROT|nr:ROK family transcriptional regulator [Arboricoccus pini]SNB77838.1 Sugar kinase of the NBD/HSP70 family, may contain an N-terminal HTH domain [Arboricoccus pini]
MMLSATNVVKAKLINRWLVFDTIRRESGIARAGIATSTGLSKQAISDLVDELIALGLIKESKSAERRVGKPPTPLCINPEGAYALGFHVDVGQMSAIVANLAGDVLCRRDQSLNDLEPERAVTELFAAAKALIREVKIPRDRFLGIGLATPGPFGVAGLSPPRLPGWDGLRLRTLLHEASGFPVSLSNDGQCATIAEWRFGDAARGLTHFVYVYFGIGMGSGVMINSAIFGGASGNAGELGHLTVVPGGHECICGKRGCLETYVSVDAAIRHLSAEGIEVASPAAFAATFDDSHPLISSWIGAGVEPFRNALNALENLFDPQTIMIGGNAPDWLIEVFMAKAEPLLPSVGRIERTLPRIIRSDLGVDAVVRGAAVLPLLTTLNPQYRELNPHA